MFEMTYGELFLFMWAVIASAGAWQWRSEAQHRAKLVAGASMFVRRVVEDDKLRDELRRLMDNDTEFKFGLGE